MITCPTCKGQFPSYPEFTAHIGNPGCANEIIAAPALEHPPLRSLSEAAEANAFHAHLDVCFQCANNPFDLCPLGAGLIRQAAPHAFGVHGEAANEDSGTIARLSGLTAYQSGVFLILTDGRTGKRFGVTAAVELITKYSTLIAERERRRFEPLATARALIEAEANSICEDIDTAVAARAIIKHISDAAIELAFVRHSLTSDEFDESDYRDAKAGVDARAAFIEEIKQDTINCLTGDDFGCLDESELDETNCELLWLQRALADSIPRTVFDAHTSAVGTFLSEMAEIYSLDALDPAPVTVKETTEALLRISREIREQMSARKPAPDA